MTEAQDGSTIKVDRTELVWPGKYNADGTRKEVPRVNLPFQVIETINESRATREAEATRLPSLFDVWKGDEAETFEEGWRNKLIWGDNLLVMGSLLEKFAGKIDLIYIDPPFATGADFSFLAEVGDGDIAVDKEQSLIEEKAYRDTWARGLDSYIEMMASRLALMRDLLSITGTIVVHVDWRVVHPIKLVLDELLGRHNFRNHIIWKRQTSSGYKGKRAIGKNHDDLIVYSRSENFTYNPIYIPYDDEYIEMRFRHVDAEGRRFKDAFLGSKTTEKTIERLKAEDRIYYTATGGMRLKIYLDDAPGIPLDDVWTDINFINSMAGERVNFDTQKPEVLLGRVVTAFSNVGDLVADFFCGSGTTPVVAERASRRWIGCDLSRWAIHLSRKRLLEVDESKPLEILNLGKYERQYWSGVTFGEDLDGDGEIALYEYLSFILKLYAAEPLSGMQHLHGRRGKAVVHVGAVESPVTIAEVIDAMDECVAMKQFELHVLGWEWEMGLAGPNNDYRKGGQLQETAKEKGIKLLLLQIPREVMEEQAVDKGDISFFELAYLDLDINKQKRKISIKLTNFVIPNTELIPEDVREKITKWSDFIDYWAVDWDFRNDTFMQGWVTYRTRKDRRLELASAAHTYEKAGHYRVVVKVIDIFGNDTSQAYDVKVS